MRDFNNYSLRRHNTFGIDARCARFVEFDTEDEIVAFCGDSFPQTPYIIIGGGSNLLLKGDYDGMVLRSAVNGIGRTDLENGDVLLRCGSGEVWDHIVAMTVGDGLYGMENMSLIPGDVGASAVQNIGAYGVEVKDIIHKVEAVEISTGRRVSFTNADCQYAYRQSRFKGEWKNKYLITYVTYRLSRAFNPRLEYGNIRSRLAEKGIDNPTASELRQTIIEIRREKLPDPEVTGNAGSFFVNPIVKKEKYLELKERFGELPHYDIDDDYVKIPAGWMIDQCGWKGKSLGAAGVHDKQALVLVNRGGATGGDIINLYKAIYKDVKDKFGIEISPEVNIV